MRSTSGSSSGKTSGAGASCAGPSPTLCWMLPKSPETVEGKVAAAARLFASPQDVGQAGFEECQAGLNPQQASWLAFSAAADAEAGTGAATPPRFR